MQQKNCSNSVKLLSISLLIVGGILSIIGILSLHKLQTHYSVTQFLPSHHPGLEMDQAIRRKVSGAGSAHVHRPCQPGKREYGTWLEPQRMKL